MGRVVLAFLLATLLGACGEGGPEEFAAARQRAVDVMHTALSAAVTPGHEIPSVTLRETPCEPTPLSAYGGWVYVPESDLVENPFEAVATAMRAEGLTVTEDYISGYNRLVAKDGAFVFELRAYVSPPADDRRFSIDTGCYRH